MPSIGRLFFDIGGDKSKLDQALREAVETAKSAGVEVTRSGQSIIAAFICRRDHQGRTVISEPIISLFCTSESCNGMRFFKCTSSNIILDRDSANNFFIAYTCCNCGTKTKLYAVIGIGSGQGKGEAIKLGELPPFGPHVPSRVISLIGPDRELFLMGRRAENQGMGIGAFAYYRRVVENQKNRIIAEIKRVAEKT